MRPISAGWAHSLALRADGRVVAWGNNEDGQTNVALLPTDLVAVTAGYFHSAALRANGTVVTWGWEVPVPPDATNVVSIAAGWEHCLALRADGTVLAWGDNTYGLGQLNSESATAELSTVGPHRRVTKAFLAAITGVLSPARVKDPELDK